MNLEQIDIQFLINTARRAGEEILKIYRTDFSVSYKEHDKSPLTEADIAANEIITQSLLNKYPEIPFLSEEGKLMSYETRKDWTVFWLIDPLDGTKEFVEKRGDFTVNIALIENGIPVLGVVFAPDKDLLYYARKGDGAYKVHNGQGPVRLPVICNASGSDKKIIVASRNHMSPETQDYIDNVYPDKSMYNLVSIGSSLKFCLVAEGSADLYPRLGPTMEWDTAAAHAIILEAGKRVNIVEEGKDSGKPVVYNKEQLLNPWFVAN